jgi:hypothetical protein
MTFDLRIITVDYGEWTLWASLAISTAIGCFLGWRVGKRIGVVVSAWRRWILAALAALLLCQGVVMIAIVAFAILFAVSHEGASVCTLLVQRALFIPSVISIAAGAAGWRHARGGMMPKAQSSPATA